jgi:outer membrane protein
MKRIFLTTILLLGYLMVMPALAAKDAPGKEAQSKQKEAQLKEAQNRQKEAQLKEAQSKPQLKIGIVDMQKILRESKSATAVRSSFMKELEAKKEQINTKAKEVQNLEEDLSRLDPGASVEAKRQRTDKLKIEARELNNLRQDVEEEVKRKDREMAQKLFAEIMQIVRNYARNERYSLILERATIIAAEEGIDITDKILKLYDSQKK